MKRITVEMVKEAYVKTGLKPTRGKFYNDGCACAIGAIYTDKSGQMHEEWADDYAKGVYGRAYARGFVQGFDGEEQDSLRVDNWVQGYKDGRAAWEAVKPC